MKTPPLLLGLALLFWGWQADYRVAGAVMAVIVEGAQLVKARREFSDEDLHRIWLFCMLALLTAIAYAFTNNDGPASLGGLLQNPTGHAAQDQASNASQQAALEVFRWSPMFLFLFIVAQLYGSREKIPWATISLWGWQQRMKALKAGRPQPATWAFNPSYPYFALCLLAASFHPNEQWGFFWGLCLLVAWALWPLRPRRFGLAVWAGVMAATVMLSYGGQRGMGKVQQLVAGYTAAWLEWATRGNFDPAKSKTSLGQIGQKKGSGKIVLRLEAKTGGPPAVLREASYCVYKSTVWLAGATAFEDVNVETNGTSWMLLPPKTNTATVSIASYLEGRKGLLPLPPGCWRLDNLDVFPLQKNPVGAVWAEGPGLVIFDAHYGPGATIDAPPDTNNDLLVPKAEAPALDRVIAEAQLAGMSNARKLQAVQNFFARKFTYSLWQKPPPAKRPDETPLSRFLLETRSGHCEYFATATVLLLRELGIPTRYAVGYAVHESAGGNKYVVRLRDAHAWCLVWNTTAKTWEDFDTTPGSWIDKEAERASPLQFVSDGWSWLWFQFSKFRWGQSNVRQYLFWALLPVLAFLLVQIIRKGWRRGGKRSGGNRPEAGWPGLDSEFYGLERQLAEFISPRRGDEALADWLKRTADHPVLAGMKETLRELLKLHYRHRFDPQGLSPVELNGFHQKIRDCRQALTQAAKPPS